MYCDSVNHTTDKRRSKCNVERTFLSWRHTFLFPHYTHDSWKHCTALYS